MVDAKFENLLIERALLAFCRQLAREMEPPERRLEALERRLEQRALTEADEQQ
jgi:hypothetical protein